MATRKSTPPASGPAPASEASAETSYDAQWSVAGDPTQSLKKRVAALEALGWQICADKQIWSAVLDMVRDTAAPSELRLAALAVVQSASFDANGFAPLRPDYLRTLRAVGSDPDTELRQRALGMLAREHDAATQTLLMAGLKDPGMALVPPEKALQLLSYDVHTEAYPIAREIARNPPNPLARREALRLLAADADSAPMFEKLLKDKKEAIEVRQLAASALHQLAPKRLASCARDITLDAAEAADIKAVSLTALTFFGDEELIIKDDKLNAYVVKLGTAAGGTPALKRAAKQFVAKRRQ
jgi:hypothetical protein